MARDELRAIHLTTRKELKIFMFQKTIAALFTVSLFAGCAPAAYNVGTLATPAGEYCHKKLEPLGSSDPGRPAQSNSGDYIDYYGACDGPTMKERIEEQRRFEQFRFGRDYIDR